MLQSGERYFSTGKQFPALCAHENFEAREQVSSGYIIIAICTEQPRILLCPAWEICVFSLKKKRGDVGHSLHLKEIWIPPNSVFVGTVTYNFFGLEWSGRHALWYHSYIISNGYSLKDAAAFAYSSIVKPSVGVYREPKRAKVYLYKGI